MDDNEIIGLYWRRDESAITASADKYGGYCRAISYNILHDAGDAEECVNDTWLGAWRSIPPHRPQRLAVYLGKITRNLSLNRLRGYSAEKRGQGQAALALCELEECVPDRTGVEQLVGERLLVNALNAFLRAQPEQKRAVFIRRYWYLSPIGEIAGEYGMSESKVASMLFRMRKALRQFLIKEGIEL